MIVKVKMENENIESIEFYFCMSNKYVHVYTCTQTKLTNITTCTWFSAFKATDKVHHQVVDTSDILCCFLGNALQLQSLHFQVFL